MSSYDSWKTTEPSEPGTSCELCSDRAVFYAPIQGVPTPIFLCDSCHHDQVTSCEDCGEWIWQSVGVRVFTSSSLYCPSCAAKHPNVILGRAHEAKRDDEKHDEFDQVRR